MPSTPRLRALLDFSYFGPARMLFLLVFAVLCIADPSTSLYNPDQSASVSKLSAGCVSVIKNDCPLTQSDCAESACHICTALGITPSLEPCCNAPTPTKCFANNYISGVTSSGAAIPAPSLDPSLRSGATACKVLGTILYSCEAATPG